MGGITSAASITTGNGLSGAGTVASPLTVAAPSFNSVGSYCTVYRAGASTAGGTYSAGGAGVMSNNLGYGAENNLSGTWRLMGASSPSSCHTYSGVAVRVA